MSDGPTFWGWALGPHPKLKMAGVIILIILCLYAVIKYIHWLPVALFVVMVVVAYLLFRDMFFEGDGVRAVVFNENPDIIDIKQIGYVKFEELQKVGTPRPFSTSYGAPIYAVEELTKKTIRFSWIHMLDHLEFVRKFVTYKIAKEVAEDVLEENLAIRDVPGIIGAARARKSIRVYETEKDKRVFTLDSTGDDWKKTIEDMDRLIDPLQRMRNIKEKTEEISEEEVPGSDV